MTPRTPRLFAGLAASQPDQVAQGWRDSGRTTSDQPRHADGSDAAHPARSDEYQPNQHLPARQAASRWRDRYPAPNRQWPRTTGESSGQGTQA